LVARADFAAQVETPEAKKNPKPESNEYHTLGQFYAAIKKGKSMMIKDLLPLFNRCTRFGLPEQT
jgi:hypothetical protein